LGGKTESIQTKNKSYKCHYGIKGLHRDSPAMPAGASNMYDYTGYGLELKDGAACVVAPSISLVENRYDYTLVLANLFNCAL
jgi:hypothetical protein